ncbi:MAG TPA: beta-propeller fold lactonase family protein [Candidatus Acidoferrum sp.]|nr:beta-propeller fold lactonase family protein [Candidatus Acidoferrum sp.]
MARRPETSLPAVTASCHPLQYTATAMFNNRTTKDVSNDPGTTWTSSSTSVASISNTGLATGVGLGTTNISASFGGASSTGEPLAVDQLNSISVSPSLVTLGQSVTQAYAAAGHFTLAAGGASDFDISSQVTWDSSDKTVATIDGSGNATTVGPGSTTITATSCDGITVGMATLLVTSPVVDSLVVVPAAITISTGSTTLFTVMEKLPDNTIQALPPGTVVAWSSDATTTATVDPNSGVALGVAAGTAHIIASSTGLNSGTATLTVQAATARFAYIANGLGDNNNGSISGYSVDVTSATPLVPLGGSPFAAATPQQVILHPSGDFLYFIDFGGSLHVLDIDRVHGTLSDPLQTPVPASPTPSANVGAIDPTGRFIYVISDVGNSIYAFSINQTVVTDTAHNGALTSIQIVTAPTDPTLNAPVSILIDHGGKYLYVVNNGGNSVSEYSIAQTGASAGMLTLLSNTPVPTGAAPFFSTTDVNGHVFVANSGDQTVSVYSINPSSSSTPGQLTQVGSNFPVPTASTVFNVLTDPTGKYLYVLDSPATAGQVFAFGLNPTSTTSVIGSEIGTAQPTGQSPIGMAIDPTGVLLAIDNNFDNTISLFTVAGAGSTTPPPGGIAPTTPPTVNTDVAPQFVVFYTATSGQ